MTFKAFIYDRLPTLGLLLCAAGTIEIFLLMYPVEWWIRLYIPVVIIAAALGGLVAEYRKRAYYYSEISETLDNLEDKFLIHSLMPQADFADAHILEEIMYETNKSMIENVNRYKLSRDDYKEYIELWIHDIKLPIAAGKMIVHNNDNEITESIGEELDKIEKYTESALFYARSNSVEKDYFISTCNLHDIVTGCIKNNKTWLIRNHFRMILDVPEIQVKTDPKWISFVLDQIIGNSIKYCSDSPFLSFAAERGKECVLLHIRDNGIGISEADLPRIFEKGFTGTNGRNAGRSSTGIGLYLCRKLCTKIGVGIDAESDFGKGTEITLTFPDGSFVGEVIYNS